MSSETENISHLQYGSVMESVADNRMEAVKLTGFNQLNEQVNDDNIKKRGTRTTIPNSISATDFLFNINRKSNQEAPANSMSQSNMSINNNSKWPWAQLNGKLDQFGWDIHRQQHLILQHKQQHKQQVSSLNEPFQVVWQKLAFEVKVSTYDKLISRFLMPMKSKLIAAGVANNDNNNSKVVENNLDGGVAASCRELSTNPSYVENNNISIVRLAKEKQLLDSSSVETLYRSNSSSSSSSSESNRNDKKVIFKNLNGCFRSGEITAILGPSGAGKTSLVNAISGKSDNYHGNIQLIGGGSRRMRLSIIPQRDYLIENLTVRENLLYASKILNTSEKFDHEENILRVSRMLNLNHCFHSMTSNISGGEYKRVSIAQELLRQPDILVLDEPTSGLDSLNCKNLIKSLSKLIENSRLGYINPMAIVMTIHQPDVEIYQMFDHVYCMARGGRVIYDGHPKDTLKVIREQAGLLGAEIEARLAKDSLIVANPANLLIEIASEDLYGQRPIDLLADYQKKQFSIFMINNKQNIASSPTHNASSSTLSSTNCLFNNNNNRLDCSPTPKHHHQQEAIANNEQHHQLAISIPLSSDNNINKGPNKQLLDPIVNSDNSDSNSSSNESSHETETLSIINNNNNLKNSFSYDNIDNKKSHNMEQKQQNELKTNKSSTKIKGLYRDKRLQAKIDHDGKFWHHTIQLTKRAFTASIRNPLMSVVGLVFHLFIPFVMYTVYSPKIGTVKGCPIIQREFDLISMTSNNTLDLLKSAQDDVHSTFECSTMFFLTTYCFSLCSMTVAALTFPLNMHVLLKEVRNGWYNLPSFVVAKTISNSPFEVLFPVISIVTIYVLLGMPSSYMEWKMMSIALVMTLISMISSTIGFIFGAFCMDSMQTAVFLSISSSLPQVVLSGFTARIYLMPKILQHLSWLSLYRYSSDSINIIRFGYENCPCNSETAEYLQTHKPAFSDIPSNAKPLFNYYLSSTVNSDNNTDYLPIDNTITGLSYDLTVNLTERSRLVDLIETNQMELFDKMANLVARSFSFGNDVQDCSIVRSEILNKAGTPKDEYLPFFFLGLFIYLIITKVTLFMVVKFKIKSKL